MTWASTSMSRSISRTGLFLKRQVWVWPVLATVLLSVVAYGVRVRIESTMRANLQSQLETLLNVEVGMLEKWIQVQISNATTLANNQSVREPIYKLLETAEKTETPPTPQALSELQSQLRRQFTPAMTAHEYVSYIVVNKSKDIIAASQTELIGKQNVAEYDAFFSKALKGEATVCPPFPSTIAIKDETGQVRTSVPTMFVSAPVRDASFEIVAAIALRIRPEIEMTHIMQMGQIGESGETYAFDRNGLMVSNSRFDESLILTGLLADLPHSKSILNIQLRDPQGNLLLGQRPKVRRSELELTLPAREAIAGRDGINLDGYRDYRGVPVVGAWRWLKKYDMGVVTEIDYAEAFRPLSILQWTFWGLFILLGIGSIAIFVFTIIVARLRRDAQKASIEARQLGQYNLETKLGQGGMGVVYKGHHAMLRRPTAIKLLDVDKVNDESIQRFEREVQITCQLNHPNTVAIYDYGRTPEGVFYYAMEYLDGINLQTLVELHGPQSESRVIYILEQLCGSLFEAHSLGLVHRDIKPANLMLNRRGGEADVLKVLDFGLVKAVDESKQAGLTSANSLTGTPLYMAPEAIQSPNSVDNRSDLYAVGAVGYFLLTGKPIFDATNLVELCQQHIDLVPMSPSERLGKPISETLEDAIMKCLEKSRAKRPQTARDLMHLLARCPAAGKWTSEDAEAWWDRRDRGQADPSPVTSGPSTNMAQFDRTIVGQSED